MILERGEGASNMLGSGASERSGVAPIRRPTTMVHSLKVWIGDEVPGSNTLSRDRRVSWKQQREHQHGCRYSRAAHTEDAMNSPSWHHGGAGAPRPRRHLRDTDTRARRRGYSTWVPADTYTYIRYRAPPPAAVIVYLRSRISRYGRCDGTALLISWYEYCTRPS